MRLKSQQLLARFSPRTRRLLSTVAASYAARLAAALVLLITVPLARLHMSAEGFGIWMMLSSLLGFFAFADLGIGNGVLNRLSAAVHSNQTEQAARLMVAGSVCTAASGVVVLAAWAIWLAAAQQPLAFAGTITSARQPEALAAFTTFIALLAVNLPAQLVQKFQLAYQDGHWVGLAQLAATLLSLLLLPLGIWLHWPLAALVLCSLGVQVAVTLLSALIWLRRRALWAVLRTAQLHGATVRALLRTSALFFALQLCAAFAFQSDAFVIAQVLGQAAYGDFAAIQRLFLSLSTLVAAALVGLWPAFGEALARDDVAWARQAFLRSLAIGALVMTALSLTLSFSMSWLVPHWLHRADAPPLALLVVLSVWTVIEMLGQITGTLLNGAGILRIQVLVAATMATLAFAAKWWFVATWGAWGAVAATVVVYSCVSVPAQAWLVRGLFAAKSRPA